ncbi:mtDNA inheritance, partitioning of the mitochondrial organelle [Elasticomyces elasticus]|nr:mtDNA inheritance, partitioning of the mitochondrial organelle [Elasticomyces elasticus]
MHEVITLQFGPQANHLGTHYWNIQESYFTYTGQPDSPVNHDISFRPGLGPNGDDTYSPRTLIYDLKGAFGTLRRENALYEIQQQDQGQPGGWSGATIPLQLSPIAPSPYQQALDDGSAPPRLTADTVRYWSDYNHIFYHPRSLIQLNTYESNSSLMPFEHFATGEELFRDLDREHDLLDRDLRPWLEECDHLQALQILTGTDDAWGGFAARYLERINDEMGKGCRWVFGLQDSQRTTRQRQAVQNANVARSLVSFNDNASMHIPLASMPGVLPAYVTGLDGGSKWQTSALQAAVMESFTLPSRLRQGEDGRASFDMLETTLNNEGNRSVAAATMSVSEAYDEATGTAQTNGNGHHDARMANGHTNVRAEDDAGSDAPELDISFLPPPATNERSLGRRPRFLSTVTSTRGHDPNSVDEEEEMNALLRDRMGEGPRVATYRSSLLFPGLSSFPPIFRFQGQNEKFAIKTSVSMTSGVAERIRGLESSVRTGFGVDVEEREALCDSLVGMAEGYEEGWMSDDDDDFGGD